MLFSRGFGSLIPTTRWNVRSDSATDESFSFERYCYWSSCPRSRSAARFFDENALNELTESVREHGVVQPIVVTTKGDKYLIVAGERRWRAANMNLMSVPYRQEYEWSKSPGGLLIENLQRHDLNALSRLFIKNCAINSIWRWRKLALLHGVTRVVSNTLRLMKLPKSVQQAVWGAMSKGKQGLLTVCPMTPRKILWASYSRGVVSARIEQVDAMEAGASPPRTTPPSRYAHADAWKVFSKRFGTGVKICTNGRGAVRLVSSLRITLNLNE